MDIRVNGYNMLKLGIIDIYDSLIWNERFDSYGDFELHTMPTPEIISLLALDNILTIKDSNKGMIIESNYYLQI